MATTRARLLLLVAAILAPPALFALVLFLQFADAERGRYRAEAVATAQQVSTAVDREIVALLATLEALAAAPSLAPGGDLAEFRQQAMRALQTRGYAVVLRDRAGQQWVNTLVPDGTPLPRTTDPTLLATDRLVFETGKPAVSDLFQGASGGQNLVVADAPVIHDQAVRYAMSIALDSPRLSAMLEQAARPGWTISLIDRQDRLIATSRGDLSFIGRTATEDLRRNARGPAGTWLGTTLDGVQVLGAYARSAISGWRVAVGVPVSAIAAPLQRLTLVTMLSGLAVGVFALALALRIARTISVPISHLARAAERIGGGTAMPHLETGLAEVDEVGAALAGAQQAVAMREAALQASEERFRAAVHAVEGWIWTNDAAGRMTNEQPGWSALTGQTASEYEGFGWAASVHPDEAEPSIRAWEEAVRARTTYIFEHRVRRWDGVYRRFSIRAIPILDAAGAIKQWVGVHTDITEEYEAKAQLAAQEQALRDLNATLARRVEQASAERDRIWRVSTELMVVAQVGGVIVAANPACTITLGWTEAGLVGRSFDDLVHPDDRLRTAAEADRLRRGATTLRFENRWQDRTGGYRWLSWTAVADGGMLHAIARDITVEKAAADALRRTEEQLRQSQKMEVVGQLTGGVAHDFNNLLTVVTGHIEMAARRLASGGDTARLERNLEAALEGARRAAVLTHRLLAFSRQSPLRPERVDLNAVIGGMTDLIRRTLGETIEIETELQVELWPVEADLNQIENAILNLCVNARDAMPIGGLLTIETGDTRIDPNCPAVARGDLPAGAYVVLSVSDTGEGIAPEIQDRVFEPFFTTKPVGKGTGLGLSQVFGFMRQSGGLATLSSQLGAGTKVSLYFPRATGLASAAPAQDAEPGGDLERARGELCLVVEDEEMVREFSVTVLEEAGYRVLSASDGPSGLRLLDGHPDIRLLFTDLVLTGPLNGLDVAAEAVRRRPGLKVLLTTGYTKDALTPDGPNDPEFELINKPFTATALVAKLNAMLAPALSGTAR